MMPDVRPIFILSIIGFFVRVLSNLLDVFPFLFGVQVDNHVAVPFWVPLQHVQAIVTTSVDWNGVWKQRHLIAGQ